MHIILKDPVTGEEEGLLCVERKAQTCFILFADIDRLETLVNIAKSQKVPAIMLVVPDASVEELESLGWHKAEGQVLLTKGLNGNGK